MDSTIFAAEPTSQELAARLPPDRFRIGGKLIDRATQKRIKLLLEEENRMENVANAALKESEETKSS